MHEEIYILGAGGHAKVLIDTLQANGHCVAAVYDDDPSLQGTAILGVPIKGSIRELPADFARPAVIGIGDNRIRRHIARRFPHCPWVAAVHPTAMIAPTAELEPGTIVCAGAVVQCDVWVGQHVIVNTGATVDHDCTLGDYCHIGPGAHIAGQVTIEEGVFAGIGCCTIQNVKVGAWTTVGAGAAVIRDLPDRVTAVGVPAVVVKKRGLPGEHPARKAGQ